MAEIEIEPRDEPPCPTPSASERAKAWWARTRAREAGLYTRSRWPRTWRVRPWMALIGASLTVIALVIVFWDWNILRRPIEGYASAAVGRAVRIDGDVHVDLGWTSHITIDRISIANPDWAEGDMARIDRLAFDIQTIPLLSGGLIFPQVQVEGPVADLIRDKDGRANWRFGSEGTGAPMKLPVIGRLLITNGRVHVNDIKHAMVFDGTVESREGPNGESPRAFTLKGSGTLARRPFTAMMTGDSPLRAGINHPYVFDARMTVGPSTLVARGSIPKPFDLGAIAATIEVSGNDMADLYLVTSLVFPNTPAYRVTGHLTRDGDVWTLTGMSGRVGHSDLAGSLSVDSTTDRPYLVAEAHSKRADINDIAALFGARGPHARVAAAPASTKPSSGTITVATTGHDEPAHGNFYSDTLSMLPDAPLDVDRVRHMDARVHYTAAAIQAGSVPIQDLAVTVKLDHGLIVADPMRVTLALGKLSGNARLNARRDIPDVDVALNLAGARLEKFFGFTAGKDQPAAGDLEAHLRLHGRGLSVHRAVATATGDLVIGIPKGEIRQSLAELLGINVINGLGLMLSGDDSRTNLRCAVADFHADNGVIIARRFVIDTEPVLATATGRADLRNETVDLRIVGHPKKFRIGRVMAPITISGKLSHPNIGIEAGKVAVQAGAAGLLSLLNPVAALIPFISMGSGKDVDCARLLAGGPAPVSD